MRFLLCKIFQKLSKAFLESQISISSFDIMLCYFTFDSGKEKKNDPVKKTSADVARNQVKNKITVFQVVWNGILYLYKFNVNVVTLTIQFHQFQIFISLFSPPPYWICHEL